MHKSERYVRHFNRLNGKPITKKKLKQFHSELKKELDSKRIDVHCPYGIECIQIEKRLSKAIKKMNGYYEEVGKVKINQIPIKRNLIITPTIQGKEIVKGKKVLHYERKSKSKEREPVKRTEIKKDPVKNLSGFTTADQAPEVPENMIKLPGTIGNLLGEMQGYKLEIVIAGETHSSKSELGKQIADAFASAGFEVALIDWEQGGLASRDTMESIKRNIKPENLKKIHVSSEVPRDLESVKALAKQFKVILLDSGTKLNQVTNEWIDELRNEYPDTIWIILMQQNTKGGTRGGSAAEFDSPVVLKTYRPDEADFKKNYAYVYKNRGNKTGVKYLIHSKKILNEPNEKEK